MLHYYFRPCLWNCLFFGRICRLRN
jgi:hypothetical protein